jgi:hypothetical protein
VSGKQKRRGSPRLAHTRGYGRRGTWCGGQSVVNGGNDEVVGGTVIMGAGRADQKAQ